MFKRYVLATTVAFVALGVWADGLWAGEDELAQLQIGGPVMTFVSQAPSAALTLTVSGEGVYFTRDYGPGETLVLSAVDEALSDGSYKYELSTVPARDEVALLEADKTGDELLLAELWREYQQQVVVQTGSFEVVGGQIAGPKYKGE